jgi:hypothetical protein
MKEIVKLLGEGICKAFLQTLSEFTIDQSRLDSMPSMASGNAGFVAVFSQAMGLPFVPLYCTLHHQAQWAKDSQKTPDQQM